MSKNNHTSGSRTEIDIVKYVADFRQAIAQPTTSSAASHATTTLQVVDHEGALDFFLKALYFLRNNGHEVKFYEMPPPVRPTSCGCYVPSVTNGSIELPVRRDASNNFQFDLTNPVQADTALTLAHEITHAVDHYLRIEEDKNLSHEHRYDKGLYYDSYSALHASRQFENDNVGAQTRWEKRSSSVFDIDLSSKVQRHYRGRVSTEVMPRLVEHQFNGTDTAERIAGLSENNKRRTNGIIDAFADRLDEVSKDLEKDSHDASFPTSFSARLRSVTNQVAVPVVEHNPPEIAPVLHTNSLTDSLDILLAESAKAGVVGGHINQAVINHNPPTVVAHTHHLTDSLDALLAESAKARGGGNNITLDDAVDDAMDTIGSIDRAKNIISHHHDDSVNSPNTAINVIRNKGSMGAYRH